MQKQKLHIRRTRFWNPFQMSKAICSTPSRLLLDMPFRLCAPAHPRKLFHLSRRLTPLAWSSICVSNPSRLRRVERGVVRILHGPEARVARTRHERAAPRARAPAAGHGFLRAASARPALCT